MKIITTDVVYLGKATPGSGGGGGAVIDALNVTPSTSAQTITASGGTDGYSPVNVAAVTSAIDANIVAGNIKKDVSILGVTGTYAPTGTISITSNGTHDVTNYATADVNVPTTAPALYREFQLDANGVIQPNTTTTHIMDFTGVKKINDYLKGLYAGNTNISGALDMSDVVEMEECPYMFDGCTGITSVDLSGLQKIVGNTSGASYCFRNCTGITTLNLGATIITRGQSMFEGCTGLINVIIKFEQVSGSNSCNSMFKNCTGLVSADLSALKKASSGQSSLLNSMFSGCVNLTSIKIDSLKQVDYSNFASTCQQMFAGCSSLPTVRFCSLNAATGGNVFNSMCLNCTSLQTLWFYALNTASFGSRTNQFTNMLSGCSNVTVHFPMAIQSTIGSWSDVTGGFGGTNTTVLFDLVTSLTGADGNTYTRQEKDSTTTATAWVYNDTLYYTSGVSDNDHGVNEPSVSDAIYSDAACTQSVTTITAIA